MRDPVELKPDESDQVRCKPVREHFDQKVTEWAQVVVSHDGVVRSNILVVFDHRMVLRFEVRTI